MIYLAQQFNAAPDAHESDIVAFFAEAGPLWNKFFPGFRMAMLLTPKLRTGRRPQYEALWQADNLAVLDDLQTNKVNFPELANIEKKFVSLTRDVEARLVGGHVFLELATTESPGK